MEWLERSNSRQSKPEEKEKEKNIEDEKTIER